MLLTPLSAFWMAMGIKAANQLNEGAAAVLILFSLVLLFAQLHLDYLKEKRKA